MVNPCVLVLGLLAVQLCIWMALQQSNAPIPAPATAAGSSCDIDAGTCTKGDGGHGRGSTPSEAVSDDPMPGVHMVYMYVNGSDPKVSQQRRKYGGSAKGRSLDMAVTKHERRCFATTPDTLSRRGTLDVCV